eukprot:448608-Amphidinium_carterae.1
MVRHRQNVRDQYQHEFRTELDSVKRELDLFQEANAENDEEQVRTLHDELLCANQRNALSEQRLVTQLGEFNDTVLQFKGKRTTIAELQQELVHAKSYVTPRKIHIPTPDFGAVGMGASIQLSNSKSPLRFSLTPPGTGLEAGSPSVYGEPPGLGKPPVESGCETLIHKNILA